MNKAVVACLIADDLLVIQQTASRGDRQVIAVALDFGNGPALRELHDAALAAGAVRCHALDVRDEFARDCVLLAIHAETITKAVAELRARTSELVSRKLELIALLEGSAGVISRSHGSAATARRPSSASPPRPAHVTVAFEQGAPVSLNGVAMSLAEALDSLSTVAAVHGIDADFAALGALHLAYHSLAADVPAPTGSINLLFANASMSVREPDYATT